MAGMWRIERASGLWLVRGNGRAAARAIRGEVLGRESAAARVDAWFPDGWGLEGTREVAEICRTLEGVFPGEASAESGWLKRALRRALRDGRVTAVRAGLGVPEQAPMAPDVHESTASAPPTPREQLEWIHVELVDDKGKPVSDAPVLIELPNGSIRRGSTDGAGRLRLEGIEGGMCRIQFPEHVVSR